LQKASSFNIDTDALHLYFRCSVVLSLAVIQLDKYTQFQHRLLELVKDGERQDAADAVNMTGKILHSENAFTCGTK
jgi:hypothetical protein